MIIVNEIFYSIQGESTYAGLPCVFVRFTGCNLRCSYCDTQYAYADGKSLTLKEIQDQVSKYDCQLVEITGGEPLLQTAAIDLARIFLNEGKTVLVETNGTQNIEPLPASVVRIMDIKCPGSGESNQMEWKNLDRLRASDNVKFVISHRADFDWAVDVIRNYHLLDRAAVLFSPAFGLLAPKTLAAWMLELSWPIRLNLQLHKYVWKPSQRGV